MKINVQSMLHQAGQAAGGHFRHTLPELGRNLRELQERTTAGDMTALKEFFDLYVVEERRG